jgi:hypothetical protein
VFLFLAALLGACSNTSLVMASTPEVIVERRLPIDRVHPEHNLRAQSMSALNSVGLVTTTSGANAPTYGTGWLAVDACHIITAEHVIYGATFDETAPLGVQAFFYVGQTTHPFPENYGFSRRYSGRVVAHGKAHQVDNVADTDGHDWAVVRLDEPVIGLRPLPLVGHNSETYLGTTVLAAGYPALLLPKEGLANAGRQLWADEGALVSGHGVTGDLDFAVYDAKLQLGAGESGGPVIVTEGTQMVAEGLIQAMDTSSGAAGKGELAGLDVSQGHANKLVMFGAHAAEQLRKILHATPCTPQSGRS